MSTGCLGCKTQPEDSFDFTMAFQPILDASQEEIYAHEALVRGMNGEPAGKILGQVTEQNRYWFDQQCRVKAIELAAQLGLGPKQRLSINFLPNAVYEPAACIRMTVETARKVGLPLDRIIGCNRAEVSDIAPHVSTLSRVASDHLPLGARLRILG